MSQSTFKSPASSHGPRGEVQGHSPSDVKSEPVRGIDFVPTADELRAELLLKLLAECRGGQKNRTNMVKRRLTAKQGFTQVKDLPDIKKQLASYRADEVAKAESDIAQIRSLVLARELQSFDSDLDAWLTK